MSEEEPIILGSTPSGKKGELNYTGDKRTVKRLEEETDLNIEEAGIIREFSGQNGYRAYSIKDKMCVVTGNSYWVYEMTEDGRQEFED